MIENNTFVSEESSLDISIEHNIIKNGKFKQNLTGIHSAWLFKNGIDNFDELAPYVS